MNYTYFYIENYKWIQKLRLDIDIDPKTKVFTLVWLNESGKTTILEAINAFSKDISQNQRHSLIPKNKWIDFSEDIIIKAWLHLDENDIERIKKFITENSWKQEEIVISESFEITKRYEFKWSIPWKSEIEWWLTVEVKQKKSNKTFRKVWGEDFGKIVNFTKDTLLPDILYYPNFLFDFPSKIYLEPTEGNLQEEQYCDIIQDILTSIWPNLSIEEHLLTRIQKQTEPAHKLALEQILNTMWAKISKVVFDAWEKLFKVWKKEIIVNSWTTTEWRVFLEIKVKEGVESYYISERSLWFRWFFVFLLFTEFRKYRSTSLGELLFLLDEPASNLHSTAQKSLLKTFEDITSKSKLIYTTHSHHLINPDWLSGAYIVQNKTINYWEDSAYYDFTTAMTDIDASLYKKFAFENPSKVALFQPILDVLEYQPWLLEQVFPIAITEGKTDYYAYRYIIKNYLPWYSHLHFYPWNGADSLQTIIGLYISWAKDFLVLLDSDSKWDEAKKQYIDIFWIDLSNRIFTYENVDSKLKKVSIEDLFTEEEKLDITKVYNTSATKYKKSEFNTWIQTLINTWNMVTISEGTIKKFELIFKFLDAKITKDVSN